VPPERLVFTFEFEVMPGHVLLEMMTFEEYDGRTELTDKILFQTVDDLEGMLKSEMEKGLRDHGSVRRTLEREAESTARDLTVSFPLFTT